MFGEPALLFSNAGGNSKGETLFSQQRVSTVTASEGHDLPLVWDVCDERQVRITRPVIHQRLCERTFNITRCSAFAHAAIQTVDLLLRGRGQPTECRHLTNSPPPKAFNTDLPILVMTLMLATTYGESVSSTPILDSGDPTGPMLKGITYMTRPTK